MYRLLIVAATPLETQPLLLWLQDKATQKAENTYVLGQIQIEILITGIGAVATAWHLGRIPLASYNLAINAGIAGALNRDLSIGQVVHIIEERFGDLGIELADGSFQDLVQSGLADPNQSPFQSGKLLNPIAGEAPFLPSAKGVTVQKVHGNESSIEVFKRTYPDAEVESMEGAAFFYGCLATGIRFMEIRAISNFVEKRDRAKWDIPGAVNALNFTLIEMIGILADT